MQFLLDEEASQALLKEVLDIYQDAVEGRGLKRELIAGGLEELPPDTQQLIKNCVLDAIKSGLSKIIEENVEVRNYEAFLDAVASRVVGTVNVTTRCVLKVGDEKLMKQLEYIEKTRFEGLYPQVYSKLARGADCACLMEYIPGRTLHKMIFHPEEDDTINDLKNSAGSFLSLLTAIFIDKKYEYTQPNLSRIYLEDRFKSKYSKGLERLVRVVRIPEQYRFMGELVDKLSSLSMRINGQQCSSYDDCLLRLQALLPKINCPHSTLVHGDPHPGNVMLSSAPEGEKIRFLDPNGYIEQGDYMYDFGKILHWVKLMGFIIMERTDEKRLFDFSLKFEDGRLVVDYALSAPFKFPERPQAVEQLALEAMADVVSRFEDQFYEIRLPISLAAAYIGGFSYFEELHQVMISFCQSLLHLNQALS